jgi:hypothetical protein
MANTIGYGQGAVNNTNSWGQGAKIGSSFSNIYSTDYDGIDAHISTDATYSELDGQTKATFSLWVKPTSFAVSRMLFSITKDTTAGNSQVMLYVDTSARLRGFVSTGSKYIYTNTSVLTINTWHHILFCVDLTQVLVANRGRIFVDGIDQTATGYSQLNETIFPTSNSELFIAEDKNGFLNPFLNNMDEFAIWSGTDLRDDVATIYNSGVPNDLNDNGLTAPTSWYRFEEGSGTTISDSGSSTNNATIQNEVTFETDVPT